jgi:ABC-type multidrug transport system permease subunit
MPITKFIFRNTRREYVIIFYLLVLQIDSCKKLFYSFVQNELIAIHNKRLEPFYFVYSGTQKWEYFNDEDGNTATSIIKCYIIIITITVIISLFSFIIRTYRVPLL